MDDVTLLTPPQLAGLRSANARRGNAHTPMRGLFDFIIGGDGEEYYGDSGLVAEPSQSSGGFDWQGLLTQAPAMIKDLMLSSNTAEYQSKLMEINLDRARRGLRPIDANAYAPQMNVGLAPSAQNTIAGVGVGTLALLGVGAFLAFRKK